MTEAAGMEAIERNLGPQPLARLMEERSLRAADLVRAAPGCITFKMVTRACKGRRLTRNAQTKIAAAFNNAANVRLPISALFTYEA
jgi:hypothetical protein